MSRTHEVTTELESSKFVNCIENRMFPHHSVLHTMRSNMGPFWSLKIVQAHKHLWSPVRIRYVTWTSSCLMRPQRARSTDDAILVGLQIFKRDGAQTDGLQVHRHQTWPQVHRLQTGHRHVVSRQAENMAGTTRQYPVRQGPDGRGPDKTF